MALVLGLFTQSVNAQCNAFFSYYGHQKLGSVNFVDSSGGKYNKVTWDFGDGNTSTTNRNVTYTRHTYTKFGTYKVCRIVEDSTVPCKDTFCTTINFTRPTCFADFSYTISGNTVTFTYTGSSTSFYTWDFGDQVGQSKLKNPTYTYKAGGTYRVSLYTANGSALMCDDTTYKTITIPKSSTCKAAFTYNMNSRNQVIFTNLSTNAVYSTWYFGDGNTSMARNPTHTYAVVTRPHTVCLVIEDSLRTCKDSTCMVIGGVPCSADFVGSNLGKGKVQFDVYLSNKNTQYTWDFGDGNTASYKGGSHPVHQYNRTNLPDSFSVCLQIYDSINNCRDTICKDIYVTNDSCNASFTYRKMGGGTVQFYASSSKNASYYWSFGDGKTSDHKNPVHRYTKKGTYYPILIVRDSVIGCAFTVTDTVVIDSISCIAKPDFTFSVVDSTGYFRNASTLGNTYKWIYPGGYTDSSYNSTYTFRGPGKYTVCLVAYDTIANCSDTICKTVTVDSVKSCMAFFRIALDTTKKFKLFLINGSTNKSSHTYKWTFGDGNSSTKRNPSHKYSKFGKYEVCLTVSDSNTRCTDTYCDSLGLDSSGRLLKAGGFELVVIDDNLSIPELPTLDYTLYPNPTSGMVTLKLQSVGREGAYVQVVSLTGKTVKNLSLENRAGLSFDMADVENGMYVVRIFDGISHTQTKLVKMYK
jgi:PKD repeat protein